MFEMFFLSEETHRLMRLLYNEKEFWEVMDYVKNSDGWLIIPFSKMPVLEPVRSNTIQAYNYRLN